MKNENLLRLDYTVLKKSKADSRLSSPKHYRAENFFLIVVFDKDAIIFNWKLKEPVSKNCDAETISSKTTKRTFEVCIPNHKRNNVNYFYNIMVIVK